MARILGVDIPGDKRIDIALRYIYGIGPVNAREIIAKAQLDPAIRAKKPDRGAAVSDCSCDPGGQIRHRGRS